MRVREVYLPDDYVNADFVLEFPENAKILGVKDRHLLFIANDEIDKKRRSFFTVYTVQEFPSNVKESNYIGTFKAAGGIAYHLFEVLRKIDEE